MMNTKKSTTDAEEKCPLWTYTKNYNNDNPPIIKNSVCAGNSKTATANSKTYKNKNNKSSQMNASVLCHETIKCVTEKRDLNRNLVDKTSTKLSAKDIWQNQVILHNDIQLNQENKKSSKYMTWSWRILRRKQVLCVMAVVLLVLYINSSLTRDELDDRIPVLHYSHVPGMKGYLVWSERCKMPNIDPYLPEVMKFFQREKYKPCTSIKPLTHVEYDNESHQYILQVYEDRISAYSKSGVLECCYQSIERNYTGKNADKEVSLSECISFKKKTNLATTIDNILVKCRVKGKQVYINGHPMMPEREELRERLSTWNTNEKEEKQSPTKSQNEQNPESRPPSVLMMGIDSISRINLIRAMPKTAQYLYDNEWFEMSGYNKIDDNTFPNLMAVLTGRNKTQAFHKCPPTVLHGLDNCSFIWNTFREHGYVTAYAEDEASINTFNYLKIGFEHPPVDFYLRPFLIAAEKHLHIKRKSNLIYCLGYQHSATFVYDYALEMASRFRNEPFFGLFWTNTFSHNAISDCSSMDERMVEYLQKFANLGTLNNTIVIFFSDHGMRFGPTRNTLSGHLEERLPFMFIWLPQHLKQLHPEFVNALSVNKNRLTNPYDLHMTLKHIISLSGRVKNRTLLQPAEDCARCQTLLEPVPHNRSCEDIAIEDHWCTCIPYQSVYKNSNIVHKLAKATVTYINTFVAEFRNGTYANICAPLEFSNVENAYRAQQVTSVQRGSNCSVETYRIIFYTKPNKAIFEATLRYNVCTKAMEVTGEISRLNSYSADSECVEDGSAKKYCSCRKKKLF